MGRIRGSFFHPMPMPFENLKRLLEARRMASAPNGPGGKMRDDRVSSQPAPAPAPIKKQPFSAIGRIAQPLPQQPAPTSPAPEPTAPAPEPTAPVEAPQPVKSMPAPTEAPQPVQSQPAPPRPALGDMRALPRPGMFGGLMGGGFGGGLMGGGLLGGGLGPIFRRRKQPDPKAMKKGPSGPRILTKMK